MKNTYFRISSALAVFFFTIGFVRVASAFDLVCPGLEVSATADKPANSCTSSCPGPDDDDGSIIIHG